MLDSWADLGLFCIGNLRSLGEITDCRRNHDQPSIFAAPWAERLHYHPPPIGALLTLWSSGNVEETSAIVELWLGIRKALQSQNLKGFVLPQSCRHLFTVCLCPQYVATLVFVLVRPFLRQLTLRCFPLPDTPPHWSARPTVIGYEPPPKDFANYLDQQVIRLGPTGNKKN